MRVRPAHSLDDRLPPLLLEAERVAHTVSQGVHGRKRAGIGETFWQYRPYMAGEAASRIDWRQSARTDHYYVREREWETAQLAVLWADPSGSMDYASADGLPRKRDAAELLMLSLASLLLRAGEKIRWLNTRETHFVQGKGGLERLMAELPDRRQPDNVLPEQLLPRHSHVVLCSDFLHPAESLHAMINHYASRQNDGAIIHVLDPLEVSFAFEGRVSFVGCENELSLLVPNAAAVQQSFKQRMQDHIQLVQKLAHSAGWPYIQHVTTTAPELTLRALYDALAPERQRRG